MQSSSSVSSSRSQNGHAGDGVPDNEQGKTLTSQKPQPLASVPRALEVFDDDEAPIPLALQLAKEDDMKLKALELKIINENEAPTPLDLQLAKKDVKVKKADPKPNDFPGVCNSGTTASELQELCHPTPTNYSPGPSELVQYCNVPSSHGMVPSSRTPGSLHSFNESTPRPHLPEDQRNCSRNRRTGTGVSNNEPRAAAIASADIARDGGALPALTRPAPEIIDDNDAPVPLALQQLANEDNVKAKARGPEVDDGNDAPVPDELRVKDTVPPMKSTTVEYCHLPSSSVRSENISQSPSSRNLHCSIELNPGPQCLEEVAPEISARIVENSNCNLEVSTQSPVFDAIPVPSHSLALTPEIPTCDAVPLPDWFQTMEAQQNQNKPNSNQAQPDSSYGQRGQPWWKRFSSKFWIAFSILSFGAFTAVIGVMVGRGDTATAASVAADTTTLITTTTSTITQPAGSLATSTAADTTTPTTTASTTTTTVMADVITTSTSHKAPPIITTTTAVTTTSTTATTTATNQKCVKNVHFLQTLFDEDCRKNYHCCKNFYCYPRFAIDGDTTVASKGISYQFFFINNNSFETETAILRDYDEQDFSLVGNVAIVGASEEPLGDDYTGAVYVYERSPFGGWEQTARIVPDDIAGQEALFGNSVSLSEDVFVVGAYGMNAAYIYRRSGSTWAFETKLVPEGGTLLRFGVSVSIVGNVVAVGDSWGRQVFVFHFDSSSNSWEQLGWRIANDDCIGKFGTDVALTSDNGLLIGCQNESTLGGAGAVYYYKQSEGDGEFVFRQKIMASDAADLEWFGGMGNMIAVNGDFMVVGTHMETNGKAYIFTKVGNMWNEVAIINGSGPYFGGEVAISQNKILVRSQKDAYAYEFVSGYC